MKVAVLGSGNGGCAVAGEWSLAGHDVTLFDFEQFSANISAIANLGGVNCSGSFEGFAKISYAGHDLEKTLNGVELVFVVGPAFSTEAFGKACKPFLKPQQVVVICPSSCGGALVFKNALGLELDDNTYTIAESSTLPYACRAYEPGSVNVYHKLTGGMFIASLPKSTTSKVQTMVSEVYPGMASVDSLFTTMMQTGNTSIHPAVTLLNAARIEDTNGDFYFYENGATPCAGKLIRALDTEKIAVCKAVGGNIVPDDKVKVMQGYAQIESYEEGYRTANGFKGIKAQSQLDHRYLHEDVGYGLVFISELGKHVGVPTPITDSVILIASTIMDKDYRSEGGRTPKSLGLQKYSVEELKSLF